MTLSNATLFLKHMSKVVLVLNEVPPHEDVSLA